MPHVPRRVARLSIVGFWAVYFLLNTLRMALEGAEDQLGMLGRRAVVTLLGIGLTSLFEYALRRLDNRSISAMLTTAFLAAIPVSFAYATFNYMAFYVVEPLDSTKREVMMHREMHQSAPIAITDSAASWYFFIASWAVLYVALAYAAKTRHAERIAATYRAEAQTAQLRALRYQINPHFLFNTLNSLSTLVLRQRGDEAERMIINLANFFRTSLTSDPTEDVPLSDEIRMQRLYLDIERVRFPDRLVVVFAIPPELEYAQVPALILQPLVENAIKHGVARSSRPVTITIRAERADGMLRLTVEDDGEPDSPTPNDGAASSGIGLRNVCGRLEARVPGIARCIQGPRPNGGFRVELTLPMTGHA